jgi:hypothetical protein
VPASSVVLRAVLSVVVRAYISSQSSFIYLAVIPAFISVTQDGAGSPPPLVEVNQAILAWSMTKVAGSGFGSASGSGSIGLRHGSADPDPHQNVMDPEHW